MEFEDAVRRRRMVRTYDPDRPVERATVERLLDLATRAPSAGFSQGWRFLVLDEAADRAAFWVATSDPNEPDPWLSRMKSAPVLIVVFSDETTYRERYSEPDKGSTPPAEQDWPVPFWHIDAGMAAMILLLGAVDAGLGSLFFGVPTAAWPALRAAFAVPDRLAPVGVVSLGYAAPDVRSPSLKRGRRPLAEVVAYGSF